MQGAQTTLPVGSVVKERYIVEDLLGKGGFGAVYLVRDQRVRGNLFALKEVIDPNTEDKKRFAFEGEVLKRLDHPALPRVYRIFEDDGSDGKYDRDGDRLYMLMDYVEGPNLEQLRLRQSQKRLPLSQVMSIMAPIMSAVSYLHQQHPPIIHRDIKPANIIVPHDYKQSVLVDFGIAKEYDQEGTTTAIRRCSPGYGAPEQYARGTNVQTDVYGLAATFYALLTGTIPADALYRMTQIGSRRADPLEPVNELAPNVPQHVASAIQRAMAINMNERFASVDAFWQALHAAPLVEDTPSPLYDDVESQPTVITPATLAKRQQSIAPVTPVAPDFSSSTPPRSVNNATNVISSAPVTPIIADTAAPANSSSPHVTVRSISRERRRRPVVLLFFVLVALLALIASALFATNILPSSGPIASTPIVKKTGIATAPAKTPVATPTTKPTATPTTKPTATPTNTPVPTAIPTATPTTAPPPPIQLRSTYSGTIIDKIGPTTATMQLLNVAQNGANLRGNFVVYSPLQGSNPFSGTVSSSTVQFTVQSYGGHLPLAFTGTVQANGGIIGTYCSVDANGCNYSQGYGTWQVTPQA